MDIDLALLADAATIDASGKLNILGVFDRIAVSGFPARHGRLSLVLRFRATLQEVGRHDLTITLVGPDGKEVVSAHGGFQIGASSAAVSEGIRVPQVLNVDGVVFEGPGRYGFDVRVDGDHHASIPLRVGLVGSGKT